MKEGKLVSRVICNACEHQQFRNEEIVRDHQEMVKTVLADKDEMQQVIEQLRKQVEEQEQRMSEMRPAMIRMDPPPPPPTRPAPAPPTPCPRQRSRRALEQWAGADPTIGRRGREEPWWCPDPERQ